MPDDELRNAIDAIVARFQTDVQAQLSSFEARHQEAREAVRREAEMSAAEQWAPRLDAVRDEWQGKLQAALAEAAAEAERRVAAEVERVRVEADRAAAESLDRVRKESEQHTTDATSRLRQELEHSASQSLAHLRTELEAEVALATARVRDEFRHETDRALVAERERAAADLTSERERAAAELTAERDRMAGSLNAERERLLAEHKTERQQAQAGLDAEREKLTASLETERQRARTELEDERNRLSTEIAGERTKASALSVALDDARAALAREQEAARTIGESTLQARHDELSQALTEARAIERQAQLAAVERLSGAVRSIAAARSLSDTLNALATAAAAVAPRVALFVVNGRDLQGWRASGFEKASPATLKLPPNDRDLLGIAAASGNIVSSTTSPAPPFAALPEDRAALAVPITVGGQSVAVLYADDQSAAQPEAPASWPEAIQILGSHTSACLAYITALRTTQAMRAASAPSRPQAPGGEEDSSARRYARLLVSEIKLYNEAAVRVGREKRDLLNRLRPEIERARRLYEERVSPTVGSRGAYFQQELVQTLADGDAALLGGTV